MENNPVHEAERFRKEWIEQGWEQISHSLVTLLITPDSYDRLVQLSTNKPGQAFLVKSEDSGLVSLALVVMAGLLKLVTVDRDPSQLAEQIKYRLVEVDTGGVGTENQTP